MTDRIEGRYLLTAKAGEGMFLRARDEILEHDVDLVLLPAVPDALERARLLRELRRTLRHTDPHVAAVQDTGSYGDRPFLVLPAATAPSSGPVTSTDAVRMALDVLDGIASLLTAGLSWLTVRQTNVRVDAKGTAQVVPMPGSTDASEDDAVILASVGQLLGELLPEDADRGLVTVAARATGEAEPPILSAGEMRRLLELHRTGDAPAAVPAGPTGAPGRLTGLLRRPARPVTEPSTPATAAETAPAPEQVMAASDEESTAVHMQQPEPAPAPMPAVIATPTPATSRHVPASSTAAGPAPVAPESVPAATPEPAYLPKVVALSSLLPEKPVEGEYVPLSSLFRDADED